MIEGEMVTAIRELASRGVGSKAIARELGVARNTVRRYLRQPVAAGLQVRPAARRLTDDAARRRRGRSTTGAAGGNAVVVQRLLAERGSRSACGRSSARWPICDARSGSRRSRRCASKRRRATSCRSTSARSACRIAGAGVAVFLLVAVLSYSRRLFVKAFLNERQDDWREGIAAAFTHFGGVPRDAARRQCARAGARPRPRDRDGHVSIRPTWPSVATGTCSRARARRIARGPKARRKRA